MGDDASKPAPTRKNERMNAGSPSEWDTDGILPTVVTQVKSAFAASNAAAHDVDIHSRGTQPATWTTH